MIVGNPMIRSKSPPAGSAEAYSLTHRCWNANFGSDPSWPHPGTGPLDTIPLPAKACPGGIRSNIFFPSCWNGRDIDPADHAVSQKDWITFTFANGSFQSHVTWPVGTIPRDGLFFMGGSCPSTHPIRVPLVFLEIFWDTRQFNSMFPSSGQPFVYSYGDPTGYGQHADYVFGWKDDSLQRAMDTCTDLGGDPNGCRALTTQTDAQINQCTQPEKVNERITGYLPALPGCNPVQNGPGAATMPASCNAITYTGTVAPNPTPGGTTVINPTPNPTNTPAPGGPTVPQYGQCGGTGVSSLSPDAYCFRLLTGLNSGLAELCALPAALALLSTPGTASACKMSTTLSRRGRRKHLCLYSVSSFFLSA